MKNLKKIFAIFLVITLILTSAILFNAKSVSATTLKLNKTKITLSAGKSVNLKVLNTDKPIKWLTSDKIVATVSPKGKVTGKNAGTAFITVKVGKQNLQCKVTVKAALNKTKVILAKNDYVKLFLDGAVVKSLNSSDKKVVSVSRNGKVVGKRKGRATITVVDNNGKKYRCKIIVEDPSLNRKKVSLKINQNYRWQILFKDDNIEINLLKGIIKYICITKRDVVFSKEINISIDINPNSVL